MTYTKTMNGVFKRAKKGVDADCVSMIYDRPDTYAAIRKANRQLAPHNLVFRVFRGRGFWKKRGMIVPLNMRKPVSKDWLLIADEIVFGVGGGAH